MLILHNSPSTFNILEERIGRKPGPKKAKLIFLSFLANIVREERRSFQMKSSNNLVETNKFSYTILSPTVHKSEIKNGGHN